LNSPVEVFGALKVVQLPGMVMFLQQTGKGYPWLAMICHEAQAMFILTCVCSVVLRAA
jgi:hypothetical protein